VFLRELLLGSTKLQDFNMFLSVPLLGSSNVQAFECVPTRAVFGKH
jgi:hypothetical protein